MLAGLAVAAVGARAQVVYLQFSGTGTAYGSLDGVVFSALDWTLEIGIDTTVSDVAGDPGQGVFPSSIVSGALRLDASTYTFDGNSAFGNTVLTYATDVNDYGSVTMYFNNGGYGEFRAGAAAVVPLLFSDPHDLASLNPGASLTNIVPDHYVNASYFSFSYDPDPNVGFDYRITTTDGHRIQLTAYADGGSGDMTAAVTSSSIVPVPEPATTVALLAGAAGLVAVIVRRRR